LESPLGKGGFGEVWKAIGPGGFTVALKLLPLLSRGINVELRALETMREVHHPHLISLLGSWQVGNWLVIAMELADRSLYDRLLEVQLPQLPLQLLP